MSVYFLDKMLDKAVDRILEHYVESEFYTALGEPYVSVLKQMIRDGIKVGIELGKITNSFKDQKNETA